LSERLENHTQAIGSVQGAEEPVTDLADRGIAPERIGDSPQPFIALSPARCSIRCLSRNLAP
jgi:hypothetical protein